MSEILCLFSLSANLMMIQLKMKLLSSEQQFPHYVYVYVSNSHVNNLACLKIDLVQDFMAVLITCKSDEDSIKNKAVWRTAISPAAEWQWSGLKIQGSNWWPSIVTFTLSLHCWVTGFAHHLTKVNIWPKFNKYLLKVQEIWSEHEIQG